MFELDSVVRAYSNTRVEFGLNKTHRNQHLSTPTPLLYYETTNATPSVGFQ